MPVQPRLNPAADTGSQFQLVLLAVAGLVGGGGAGSLAETGNKTPAIAWQQSRKQDASESPIHLVSHSSRWLQRKSLGRQTIKKWKSVDQLRIYQGAKLKSIRGSTPLVVPVILFELY